MDILTVDNMCRICLQRQDTLFSLFQKNEGCSPYEKLLNRTQLKIELNDAGPASICSQCLTELETTVHFLDKCDNSNRLLSSRLQSFKSNFIVKTDAKFIGLDDEVGLYLEGDEPDGIGYKCGETDEKTVQSEDVCSSKVPTPVEAAPARCPQCGSPRRCRHWAPPATHTCHLCQKVFTRRFNFMLHLKRHLGERDWPCPSCGVRLLTRWLAQRHCEPRKRRVCPVLGCGKTFTTNTNLTTHIQSHNGEKPHVCTECGKSFVSKNTLKDHQRIHSGSKPYMCPVCGRQFRTNKLAAHLRTHSNTRGHACPAAACARAFTTARALRLHAATHAPPARAHACALCPRAYCHTQSLRKHLRLRHGPST